jgi:hypothetical protein
MGSQIPNPYRHSHQTQVEAQTRKPEMYCSFSGY